jgi:hypothetical protein
VDGIYESKVPLVTSVIERLGNICQVNDSTTFGRIIQGDKIDIGQLKPVSGEQEYLTHMSSFDCKVR